MQTNLLAAVRFLRLEFYGRLIVPVSLVLAPAAHAAPPTITYASPPPIFQAGGSVLLGNDAVIADPDSATLSKIDFLCCGGNSSLTLDPDPATMGSLSLSWSNYSLGGSQYNLRPAAGPLPTLAQWQAALRGVRVSFVGNPSLASSQFSVWIIPYDDGNTMNMGIFRYVGLLETNLIVPVGTVETAVGQPLAFTGSNVISYPDLGDYSGVNHQDRQQISLSVSHGTLSLTVSTGITFVSPNNTASPVFQGSSSQVRAALASLVYVPVAGYEGGDRLDVTLSGRFVDPQGQISLPEIDHKEIPLRVGTTPVSLQSFNID